MNNRQELQDLMDRYSPDPEALLNHILNDFLDGDQALDAVVSYLEDEVGIELDGDEEEDW